VREMMLGIVAVGLIAGVVLGRNTERARRAYKDWDAARAAVPKGRATAVAAIWRALVTGVVITVVVVALIAFALRSES